MRLTNIVLVITLLLLAFCNSSQANIVKEIRTQLTRDDMLIATERSLPAQQIIQPVDMTAFTSQGKSSSKSIDTRLVIQGRLSFTSTPETSFLAFVNSSKTSQVKLLPQQNELPIITFEFVQDGDKVIPVNRDLTLTDNKYWDYFVGVGNIWQEENDQGFFRIALPFSLIEKNENCVHNGVFSFLMNAEGKTSDFYYQISSETCQYFKADFWGKGRVDYTAGNVSKREKIISHYHQAQESRLTTKSIPQLKQQYPQIDLSQLSLSNAIKTHEMTQYGVVYQGTHYVSNCATRMGDYPFCQQLVLPSYSTAKSLFAGLVMFQLVGQYPDIFDEYLTDWVTQCSGEQWQGVTFAHLLNMTTGNYISKLPMADERSEQMLNFFLATTNEHRVKYSCQQFKRKSKPGSQFVYHTSDTYLLGVALNHYIKDKSGLEFDIYDDVFLADILANLSLSPVALSSRRTSDKVSQPYTGFGLFYNSDDVAKLSQFISDQRLVVAENRVLHLQTLTNILQKTPSSNDIKTDNELIRYNNGFWKKQVTQWLNCEQETWLPFMSGYGGISIVFANDNLKFYYFSDSNQKDWRDAIEQLNKIEPICR